MNCGKIFKIVILVSIVSMMAVSTALTAKPDGSSGTDVIAKSNGFPSGEHFNLNIHGKKADFDGEGVEPGGNSVFILEYGTSTIQYVTNRKSSETELIALDPVAEAFLPDHDPAVVQIPYEKDGYYVFGRILGKPNNGKLESVSSIILRPNTVIAACNDTDPENPDFKDYIECPDDDLLALGLIVGTNTYKTEDEVYVRFGTETKGKGKSKATDITGLFTYTGWVVDATLDTSGPEGEPDGVIDLYDVPRDYTEDGVIDEDDVEPWLNDMEGLAWYFENEWILNIADLVITEQGLENDGTKLIQIRFYPVDTTTFTS